MQEKFWKCLLETSTITFRPALLLGIQKPLLTHNSHFLKYLKMADPKLLLKEKQMKK